MKQTNKTMGIVMLSIAGALLVAMCVCIGIAVSSTKNGGMALLIAIPFVIFILLFVFFGWYNLHRYKQEKSKYDKKF